MILEAGLTENDTSRETMNIILIPNTAVFGPTNFIRTATTASTARMKIVDEDEDF